MTHLYNLKTRMCFVKKVLLRISQNSQENNCVRVPILNKAAGLRAATLFKKIL